MGRQSPTCSEMGAEPNVYDMGTGEWSRAGEGGEGRQGSMTVVVNDDLWFISIVVVHNAGH